jgi:hypothetical protein
LRSFLRNQLHGAWAFPGTEKIVSGGGAILQLATSSRYKPFVVAARADQIAAPVLSNYL